MTQKYLAILFLTIVSTVSFSQNKYEASLISDSLMKDAKAVIRYYSTEYERQSADNYVLNVHYAITILNESGNRFAGILINYDRNSKVTEMNGTLYNSKGARIKEIKKKDFNDYAYNSSYTLFSDDRVKEYTPACNSYPYTVEYHYIIEHYGIVGFGNWMPQKGFGISTEKARLTLKTPREFAIRHKERNYNFRLDSSLTGNQKQLSWMAENLKPVSYEPAAPDYLDIFPVVLLSPEEIAYEGSTGNFSSWKTYGKWVYSLIEGQDELPATTLLEIKKMTGKINDPKEKVKVLYKYMQQKTRYVNISLGIGGFRPLPATAVDEKGYGDCKALSNYMKALLKGIGIQSFYAEIGSGPSRKIKFPDFPSAEQTNHIILCVPMEKDSVWLECTNQTIPFGYITSSCSDRLALLVTDQGGILVHTPVYKTENNIRISTINAKLQANGIASFHAGTEFDNCLYEDIAGLIGQSREEQKKKLLKSLRANGLEITDFSLTDRSDNAAKALLKVTGRANGFIVKSGSRLFVSPGFLYKNSFPGQVSNKRKLNLYEPFGYCYSDTLNMTIPDGYTIEFLPADVDLSSCYGTYRITYSSVKDNQITLTRFIRIEKGNYDKTTFPEINSFLMKVARQEQQKIILKSETT